MVAPPPEAITGLVRPPSPRIRIVPSCREHAIDWQELASPRQMFYRRHLDHGAGPSVRPLSERHMAGLIDVEPIAGAAWSGVTGCADRKHES